MPALNDKSTTRPIKEIVVGRQGDGKTCSLASLAALGYKIYMLDFDKGADTLISLLTDREHFPYADYCAQHGIDLSNTTSVISIDQEMSVGQIDRVHKDPFGKTIKTEKVTVLKPINSEAFTRTARILMDWDDNGRKLGSVYSWGPDTIFVIDTVATMARYAYYYHQGINGRLGAVEDGYDHQRDVGGAQAWVRRIIEVLFSSAVKCNVIVFSHIDWIDESRGFAQSPQERARKDLPSNPDGVPSIIGQALGPKVGKFFNNVFCIRASGSGASVERKIWTVPIEKIICKRSGWLKDSYSTATGMAEIFAQLSGNPLPKGFLEELNPKALETPAVPSTPNGAGVKAPSGLSRPAPLRIGG